MHSPARTQRLSSKLLFSAANKGGAELATVRARAALVLERLALARLVGTELCDEIPAKHFCTLWCCDHNLLRGKFSADVFRTVYPIVAHKEWKHCLKIAVASLASGRLPLLLELNQQALGWSGADEPLPHDMGYGRGVNHGWTAVHHAVAYGAKATTEVEELRPILSILLAAGGSLECVDSFGDTPMTLAKKHRVPWVPVLLSEMGASATP